MEERDQRSESREQLSEEGGQSSVVSLQPELDFLPVAPLSKVEILNSKFSSACPHAGVGRVFRCELLHQLTGATCHPRPENPSSPCQRCRPQWAEEQPPTAEKLTPFLKSIVASARNERLEAPKREPISWLQAIKNAAASFKAFLKSGGKIVPAPVSEERLKICSACPHRVTFLGHGFCGGCRCLLSAKTKLPDEFCPDGRWNSLDGKKSSKGCASCPQVNRDAQRSAGPPRKASARIELPPPATLPEQIGAKARQWAVGITTAPRKDPTLARCVESLAETGWQDVYVFAEPDSHQLDRCGSARVIARPTRLGAWRNWVRTLRDLLEKEPAADTLMIVQDDIVFCAGVRAMLEEKLWPSEKTGFVSLYTPAHNYYDNKKFRGMNKFHLTSGGAFLIGACALVFPRSAAEAIAKNPLSDQWRGAASGEQKDPVKKKAIDTYVGHVTRSVSLEAFYFYPSLAQHIARYSSLGHDGAVGKRRSRSFPGESVEATTVVTAPPRVKREKISVVIPACRLSDLTIRCLEHLAAHAKPILQQIIYIDNGSGDDTPDLVAAAAGKLHLPFELIANSRNEGFTKAVNQGIAAAKSHVLCLNNDCFVGPNCLQTLLRHMETLDRVAATGPMSGDGGHQSLIHRRRQIQAGLVKQPPELHNPTDCARRLRQDTTSIETMLAFFCTLMNRDVLDKIGPLLDVAAIASGLAADDEWCRRARRHGYVHRLCHGAFAAHLHSESFRRLGIDRRALQKQAIDWYRAH